jgi:hypothetical protein
MTEENTQTENADPAINLTLKVSEVNVILAGLQELPFKVADPLLKGIITQANSQLVQAPEPAEEA